MVVSRMGPFVQRPYLAAHRRWLRLHAGDARRPCAARIAYAYCRCAAQAALVRHSPPSCAAPREFGTACARRRLWRYRAEAAHAPPHHDCGSARSDMRHPHAPTHETARTAAIDTAAMAYDGLQRLEVVIAVMLARERRWPADTAAGGCSELAAALATLPSLTLALVADAVVALGGADA